MFSIRHPNAWYLRQKKDTPKCLTLETNGACIQEAHKNADYTPKGLICRLTHPGIQHNSKGLKSIWTVYERYLFVNLKASARGKDLLGCFLKRRYWQVPFSQYPSTLLALVGILQLCAHHGPTKAKIW